MTGNSVLGLAFVLCMIAVLVQMFMHDEAGWAIACIVLLLCGCGQLIAFVYGWTKVSEWDIGLLMLAWSLCIVGGIIQVAVGLATGILLG